MNNLGQAKLFDRNICLEILELPKPRNWIKKKETIFLVFLEVWRKESLSCNIKCLDNILQVASVKSFPFWDKEKKKHMYVYILYWSSWAATTKFHRLGSLNNRNFSPLFWKLEGPSSSCHHEWGLIAHRGYLLTVMEREKALLVPLRLFVRY